MNLSILYKKLTNRKYTIKYKYVLSLLIGFVGFINFCSAYDISFTYNCGDNSQCYFDHNYNYTIYFNNDNKFNYGTNYYLSCDADNMTSFSWNIDQKTNSSWNTAGTDNPIYLGNELVCLPPNCTPSLYFSFSFSNNLGYSDSFTCHITDTEPGGGDSCDYSDYVSIGEYNTLSGEYNRLLASYSALMTNYSSCVSQLSGVQSDLSSCQSNTSGFNDLLNNCSNNLNACNNSLTSCLQQNCPETVTGINRSSLFINNIQYPGAATIKFTIPEEIERDQYINEEETNIDVIGYGYDQEKMQRMVNTQHYKPTAEEMSGLVEKVADFLPLVAVALLIARIRRVIKKVF